MAHVASASERVSTNWPESFAVAQVRIARPTNDLKAIERFYAEGLGLKIVGSFKDHAGYSGIMFGLPGVQYHLEFTECAHDQIEPFHPDCLLVLYIPDETKIQVLRDRLQALGYPPVEPANPYWSEKGITIADPDGHRVVLMNTPGI